MKQWPQNTTLHKEIFWTISNIAAGNEGQIEKILQNDWLEEIYDAFEHSDVEVKSEALYIVSNIALGANISQI